MSNEQERRVSGDRLQGTNEERTVASHLVLNSGTKLGPYEILSPLGAGGMGEVYRAHDTRLGRDVALKVLPEAFAADAERMARFQREAQVLASLNHANIAGIHGFEESGGTRALVMELVEGPTLADRIGRGPMPLDETLPIAKQVAEALEYAHERGIIHRDLKPANIKLNQEQQVKVLDFGLAKALEGAAPPAQISNSPTLSAMATQAGVILGTAAYMPPEQAKGKAVDRRADIWAFGCVAYEMLSGKQAFEGESVSETLAGVILKEPDWNALPSATPLAMRRLLSRCLAKDPKRRLQAIGEARIAIEETLSGADAQPPLSPLLTEEGKREARGGEPWRRALPWAFTAIAAIAALIFALGYFRLARAPEPGRAIVSEISSPANASFAFRGNLSGPPVISPDGQRLAFAATGSDRKQRLWVRPLNAATAQPLEGTDGATFPFWSPDGRSLGYFANGKLNRIDASGGPPLAIADAANARGGSWGADGTILFTPDVVSPLYRMPASGGTPQPMTKLNASLQEVTHRWPQFLPDGKHFLFYAHGNVSQNNATYGASLGGGEPTLFVRGESNAVYAPPGYLLFVREGTLMAQRFDTGSLNLKDEAMPLAEHAEADPVVWRGVFAVSENGLLAYQAGNGIAGSRQLLWFDRNGKQIEETGPPGYFATPSLSPDDRNLAVQIGAPGGSGFNIWVFDLARRGIRTRLTFSPGIDSAPSWSPDGKTIAFASNRSGLFHLYQKAAEGTGRTAPLVVDNANESSPSFSSDGRHLIFERFAATPGAAGSHYEIWALPLFGDRKAFPVVQNPQFNVSEPALSPDGKWLAYLSHETGLEQIYVVPFGNGAGKWQVSTGGGLWPRWRHDSRELFYLSPDNKIMSVEISEQGASLAIGKVAPLFQAEPLSISYHWPYDVSADGKKFVVATEGVQKTSEPLTLVVNWPALLKKQ